MLETHIQTAERASAATGGPAPPAGGAGGLGGAQDPMGMAQQMLGNPGLANAINNPEMMQNPMMQNMMQQVHHTLCASWLFIPPSFPNYFMTRTGLAGDAKPRGPASSDAVPPNPAGG